MPTLIIHCLGPQRTPAALELAANLQWNGSKAVYISDFAIYNSYNRMKYVNEEVNFIVTDIFVPLEDMKSDNSLNFYIYKKNHDELDIESLDMLHKYDIPYVQVEGKEGVSEVMNRHIRRAWESILTKKVLSG
jgi:hypothetical protein